MSTYEESDEGEVSHILSLPYFERLEQDLNCIIHSNGNMFQKCFPTFQVLFEKAQILQDHNGIFLVEDW